MSILVEKLRDFDYYKSKLPTYLRNSDGFVEHFRIWYDLLIGQNTNGVVNVGDTILSLMKIFDKDFLSMIAALPGAGVTAEHRYGVNSDLLDKLAAFFGYSRKFSCSYIDKDGTTVKKQLELDNEELLLLLKCQILRSSYDGSYDQYKSFYTDIGFEILLLTKLNNPANALLILAKIEGSHIGEKGYYSENVNTMFKAGLLRVESLGIKYDWDIVDITKFMIWDDNRETPQPWDVGTWGY